jgi:DNA polymerase III subunit delta'
LFELLGQSFVKKYFNESFRGNRISHSYILNGPDGIGKSVFAFYMAQVLLCIGPDKPCSECKACKKVAKLIHPDIKILSSDKKSIGVNDIRSLIDEVNIRPYEGEYKIFIIKNADNITPEGQNALLKTLEEPPDNVVIIMLIEHMDNVLQTIQSRCQILRFGRVPINEIQDYLDNKGYKEGDTLIAAALSDGILGKALTLLDKKYINLRQKTIETANKIINSDPLTGFECAKFFTDNKEEIEFIFDILTTWYRDILVFKATKNQKNIINKDFYDILVEESILLSYNRLDKIMEAIGDSNVKIKQYANFQLAVEIMVLRFQEV